MKISVCSRDDPAAQQLQAEGARGRRLDPAEVDVTPITRMEVPTMGMTTAKLTKEQRRTSIEIKAPDGYMIASQRDDGLWNANLRIEGLSYSAMLSLLRQVQTSLLDTTEVGAAAEAERTGMCTPSCTT